MDEIVIQGARIHNLKNISLSIPKHQLIVITGISGSGKSSLAFDILFEEGKNQYLRSIGILSGLDNEERFYRMDGIGPAVAIRQNTIRQSNPRSTVGSKTNILNQLAFIYACDGNSKLSPGHFLYTTADGMCVHCQGRGSLFDINIQNLVPQKDATLHEVYRKLQITPGFMRILWKKFGSYFDTPFWELPEDIREEVIYGNYENGKQSYCIERTLRYAYEKGEDVEPYYAKTICPVCNGERIEEEAREVMLHGKRLGELGKMTLSSLKNFLQSIPSDELSQFSKNAVKNITERLEQLIKFRLGHLTLYREISTLSGGELQRLFLHLHLESKLDSLIYVFDEPMAGLHPLEKESMIDAVKQLRDLGNTVIVVEHDKEMIRHADHVIEIGPKAGVDGGNVVYQGSFQDYMKADTLLSRYLFGKESIPKRTSARKVSDNEEGILLEHAKSHYLKDITVNFPLHAMVGVAGMSGSGKSSLIEDTLLKRLVTVKKYGYANGIHGDNLISDFAQISQEPIGKNANSTSASYIGIWDKIRGLFAMQPDAIEKDMSAGHFSFHSKGACEHCNGSGYERIFLTSNFSVDKICPVCHGKRFNDETLSVTYHGKTIAEILAMSISEAVSFFEDQNNIIKPLQLLEQMGMGYLMLGQPTPSLSGGEAQRIKLAKELGKQHSKNMLYVLDEATTGLSLYDTALLLELLDKIVASGNSVIVIEHNTQVLKRCDYIIELGPEGGDQGGEIIAKGTPADLKKNPASITGRYL
jgi:excinuclease ABC A subunit